jgi:hypothetical protein
MLYFQPEFFKVFFLGQRKNLGFSSHPMEMYSRARVMSLSHLFFRGCPKTFSFSTNLMKNDHEPIGASPMESTQVKYFYLFAGL